MYKLEGKQERSLIVGGRSAEAREGGAEHRHRAYAVKGVLGYKRSPLTYPPNQLAMAAREGERTQQQRCCSRA